MNNFSNAAFSKHIGEKGLRDRQIMGQPPSKIQHTSRVVSMEQNSLGLRELDRDREGEEEGSLV